MTTTTHEPDRARLDAEIAARPERRVAYRLPDGRLVRIAAELCRWEPTCGWTLASGVVVDAVRAEPLPAGCGS